MKRLTTDTPKNNLQAALNLFYIKDHETWVRGGGPEPGFEDVNLSDFIRDVAKKHFPDIEMPESNDDLIFAMAEWLMDGVDEPTGVLALLYTAAWTYSELRRKLMQYEDTGLEPEEIERIVDAYGRGHTLRTESAERLEIIREIKTDRLRELEQAEQDGRLVVLPSKTVWELTMDAGPDCDMKCQTDALDESLGCDLCSKAKQFAYERPCTPDLLKGLGKTVFLTREEAEAALAGKDSAVSDAPEEPVDPEWKERVMRTFLGGR